MKRALLIVLILLLSAGSVFAAGQQEFDGTSFELWTQEGESEGAFDYVESLAEGYMEENPDVLIDVVQKGTEDLREDYLNAALAGAPPALLWTVNDHAGPFQAAGTIQTVDHMYNADEHVDPVTIGNDVLGVPISSGNHLMLYYNRSIIDEPPQTTDELIEMAQALDDDTYGLVYNMTEPFWLVPWLGGFGGEVFGADGVTPTLDTPEMIQTLEFLHALTHEYGITPVEADYGTMETLFLDGEAAMAINGDWALSQAENALGDDLGVAPWPTVSETGMDPAPFTSGKYYMVSDEVEGETAEAVEDFIRWSISEENQIDMAQTLTRLPGHLGALESPEISDDEIFEQSARALAQGVPQPAVVEMRANWDAMLPSMNAVLADNMTPEEAAAEMQRVAEEAIRALD